MSMQIHRFYILRDDMLGYYLNDIVERLSTRQQYDGWEVSFRKFGRYREWQKIMTIIVCHIQEIEATLHCIMSIQEAVPVDDSPHLTRLFSSEVLGLLPSFGHDRVRRTMLGLIGR